MQCLLQGWHTGLYLLDPQSPLQGFLVGRRIKACGVRAISLGMGPHGTTLHIVSLLRQTRSGLPDGIEEQHGLAIRMRASSQETVHMWGQ